MLEIAHLYRSNHILQVAYYRKCFWEQIAVDSRPIDIAPNVIQHFRNVSLITRISGVITVNVLTEALDNREQYLESVLAAIRLRDRSPGIVFLDLDRGLQSLKGKPSLTLSLERELVSIWKALPAEDVLALYQHQTNKAGKPWIDEKKNQFEKTLGVSAKLAQALEPRSKTNAALPRDVVLIFALKS